MAHILDAEMLLVGMRPEVAITIVELGMSSSLKAVRTALNVEKGMDILREQIAAQKFEHPHDHQTS